MADKTGIEWTDATWQPITGCSLVSPGCTNCYAMGLAGTRLRNHPSRAGLTVSTKAGPVWNGTVRFNEPWLTQPLRWRTPRKVFVCAHGDLFHEDVPDTWIDRVFAVMALAPQHTFQVLTKRSARMRAYCNDPATPDRIDKAMNDIAPAHWHTRELEDFGGWPLPNVWLGVSAEDQRRADERVPDLLATPAAVRFVSAEPLLSGLDLERLGTLASISAAFPEVGERARRDALPSSLSGLQIDALGAPGQATIWHQTPDHMGGFSIRFPRPFPRLDWVICGGESGPGARPMHPQWARDIRDPCAAAGVAFFFKQWGEWAPGEVAGVNERPIDAATWFDERWEFERVGKPSEDAHIDDEPDLFRVGKARAGRLLDGVEHNGMPEVRP